MGQKFEFLTISSLFVPYISATAKIEAYKQRMKLFDPPCRNTEICPPWKSCLECEWRVCQFYWRTCSIFIEASYTTKDQKIAVIYYTRLFFFYRWHNGNTRDKPHLFSAARSLEANITSVAAVAMWTESWQLRWCYYRLDNELHCFQCPSPPGDRRTN